MKKTLLYLGSLAIAAAALTGCDDNYQYPPMVVPEATITPNTTIAALKAQVWQTDRNYVTTVGTDAQGQHIIIAGRVISSDATGNIFKNVVLQDATGAVTVAINAYDLYKTYQPGQQIVVDMTGLKIGAYNGLLQVGGEGTYNNAPSMTFMESAVFAAAAQPNGLADVARIDTIVTDIPTLTAAKGSVEGLQKWQSQLIRLDGVRFLDAGQPYVAGTSNTNRYIADAAGNQINVRNSSYAKFKDEILPSGTGSVTGILSYYGTDWQILLNSTDGVTGFEPAVAPDPNDPDTPVNPGTGDGTQASPYTAGQVIAMAPSSTTEAKATGVYVTGYIVGYMPTGGSSTLLSAAVFSAADATDLNVVLGPTADCADASKCIGIQLPAAIRSLVNLQANPSYLGKQLTVKGDVYKYCGGPGIKNTTDPAIDGVSLVEPPTPVTGAIYSALGEDETALTAGWTIDNVNLGNATEIWTWKTYNSKSYLNASAYSSDGVAASEAYAISPVIDLAGATAPALQFDHAAKFQTTIKELCGVVVRAEGETAWTAVTIPTWPTAGGWTFVSSGAIDLKAWAGKKIQIGFKYGSSTAGADTWEIKNLTVTSGN